MGVKRRVLQVLAGMGICETYHTINKLNESIAANGLNHLATAGSRPDAILSMTTLIIMNKSDISVLVTMEI